MKMKNSLIFGLAVLLIAGMFNTACAGDAGGANAFARTPSDDPGETDGTAGSSGFPSVLEEFALEEFTDVFFESNTLVLVPFQWGHLLRDNLRFYTVFIEKGALNFLIEIPDPDWGGDRAVDHRIFAVIIPNQEIGKYKMGESRVFRAYELHGNVDGEWYFTKNSREWLKDIEKNSIEHRVSYVYRNLTINSSGSMHIKEILLRLPGVGYRASQVVVITSAESLQEYFYINAAEE